MQFSTLAHLLRSAQALKAGIHVINGFVRSERDLLESNKDSSHVQTKQSLGICTIALSHIITLS